MKTIKKAMNSIVGMKVANKMMLIYVVGGFIPLLFISFYLIGFSRNLIIDQATSEALNNTVRLEERLQEAFSTSVNISDGIYLDEDLKHLVKTQYTKTDDVIADLKNYTTFDEYLRLYDQIESIRFYVENATILNNAQIIKTTEKHRKADWYNTALEMDGKVAFVYRYDEIKLTNHVAMVRLIKDSQGIKVGVLVINMSNISLRKMVDSEPFEIIGVLNDERIFMSSKLENEGQHLFENKDIKRLLELEGNIIDYNSHTGSFKIIKKRFELNSSDTNVDLVTLIPMERFLSHANKSIRNSILMITVSVVAALFMVYFMTRRLTDRIEEFRTNMHKVAMGDFDVSLDDDSDDEIGLLFEDLKLMSSSLENLMEKVYLAGQQREQLTIRQKEVEFKMLTSQIDPHFLYNTLETIRMEAVLNDQQNIAEIVKKLAFIMRRKLSISNKEVPLQSELELLTHYLEIQKFRFGDRISYTIENRCENKNYKILPLLLQPIVENAFIHGLEKKIGEGEIVITVDDSRDFLEITINDNGVGIPEETLKQLKVKMRVDLLSTADSIGMMNVYQRVHIFYGAPYKLQIFSEEGVGTTVKFSLPKRLEQELNEEDRIVSNTISR